MSKKQKNNIFLLPSMSINPYTPIYSTSKSADSWSMYNQSMKCPNCDTKMILKNKDKSFDSQANPRKDDIWLNLETPSKN